MKIDGKVVLFMVTAIIVLGVSYSYLAPSSLLGDFTKFEPHSEINQTINVAIVKTGAIEKSADGKIVSFQAHDANKLTLKISPGEPLSSEILNSEVIELLGHRHGDVFAATRVTKVK